MACRSEATPAGWASGASRCPSAGPDRGSGLTSGRGLARRPRQAAPGARDPAARDPAARDRIARHHAACDVAVRDRTAGEDQHDPAAGAAGYMNPGLADHRAAAHRARQAGCAAGTFGQLILVPGDHGEPDLTVISRIRRTAVDGRRGGSGGRFATQLVSQVLEFAM